MSGRILRLTQRSNYERCLTDTADHTLMLHFLFFLCFSASVPRIALFSGRGYILNKLTNRPITSTEEKIEIEFQTKQSNTTLFCAGKFLF
ncbi:unnamed protein product [Trichobilharzia regenti]|nr:unnamed protein product [Trichobilharzia regenti]